MTGYKDYGEQNPAQPSATVNTPADLFDMLFGSAS